ncbi:TonB-dependent receptor domain-containing protein [Terrimonas rubra]|uniref:TonB-dependent receptor domain-containing protein n=1 Tax=Terrimonas rubra TaxID=1035890 RepID=A0ABW6A1G5_9BACT
MRLFFLTAFLFTAFMTQAQTGKITGNISNFSRAELDGAVATLLAAKDSAFIKTSFIDSTGRFEFELLKTGAYLVSISPLGYQKYYSSVIHLTNEQPQVQLPGIILQKDVQALGEVSVTSRKPFVERKIDRTVINPDALITNAGTNALEVLEKSPGILVDADGNISLKGKSGVLVIVDDKPTYLSAADLAGYLRSLPSGSIDVIEIMTNPPARYDAAGNAGVINIRLKKNKAVGINGGINLSYGQGKYMRTNNSFNLNYRINKINLFTNISINENNTYQDLTINRYYYNNNGSYNSGFTQNSYIKRQFKGRNMNLGMDYYLTDKTTLGVVLSGFINPASTPLTNNAKVLDNNDNVTSLVEASNPTKRKWTNGSVNLNYAYKINKQGEEISANFDYIQYNAKQTQNLTNSIFTPDHVLQEKTILYSSLPADLNIKTAKLDYTKPFKGGGKGGAGYKASYVNTDNIADFFDVENNVHTPNYDFSNRFQYKELINAAYVNYSKDWTKLSLQAGLRFEHTDIKGHQFGNPEKQDSAFTRNYASLFPTLYALYRFDSTNTHQLSFSFGRRIDRPNYQDMNPFSYPMDRYTYYGGNPFLEPTFSYNFELSHTYKNMLTTSLEYSITNNLIQETNEQRGTIYYSRPGNFGKQIAYGISVNGTFPITKWWTLQLYTELKSLGFKSVIYGQILDESRFYWYVGPTNQFTITKNLSAELSGSYQTRVLVAQFLTIPVWQMRAGIAQKIWKGKGTVKLNLSDMFYTNQPGGDIRNIANSRANWLSYLDSRVLSIAFSYRFNKGKSLAARKSGGSDTEKQRVNAQ